MVRSREWRVCEMVARKNTQTQTQAQDGCISVVKPVGRFLVLVDDKESKVYVPVRTTVWYRHCDSYECEDDMHVLETEIELLTICEADEIMSQGHVDYFEDNKVYEDEIVEYYSTSELITDYTEVKKLAKELGLRLGFLELEPDP